ncbi:hypothetical protein HanLR1_Chr06g0199631 [Helianthus annuus]|nr:hypothetical protein HanLR1_Chr06g0199631 [Helianthus annuus]
MANASKEVKKTCPYYFRLGDLWKTFEECSAYGAGVPFLLNGTHPIKQYYVPYFSGMQLFIDPKNPPTKTG